MKTVVELSDLAGEKFACIYSDRGLLAMTELGEVKTIEALLDSTPNLGIYKGDFAAHNAKIYPGDLDGIVEINGFFLVHEYKKVGAPEKPGQEILLEKLRAEKRFTIIKIFHIGPCWEMNLESARIYTPKREEPRIIEFNVLEEIKKFHAYWAENVKP